MLKQGVYRRAIHYFSRSLRLHPTDVWALNNRGLGYKGAGKPKKTRRNFEDRRRIEPGFEQAASSPRAMSR